MHVDLWGGILTILTMMSIRTILTLLSNLTISDHAVHPLPRLMDELNKKVVSQSTIVECQEPEPLQKT
jgi:hypothetical protein